MFVVGCIIAELFYFVNTILIFYLSFFYLILYILRRLLIVFIFVFYQIIYAASIFPENSPVNKTNICRSRLAGNPTKVGYSQSASLLAHCLLLLATTQGACLTRLNKKSTMASQKTNLFLSSEMP